MISDTLWKCTSTVLGLDDYGKSHQPYVFIICILLSRSCEKHACQFKFFFYLHVVFVSDIPLMLIFFQMTTVNILVFHKTATLFSTSLRLTGLTRDIRDCISCGNVCCPNKKNIKVLGSLYPWSLKVKKKILQSLNRTMTKKTSLRK